MPITEPESPALALKRRRLNQTADENEEKEETDSRVIRANPLPDLDKVFQPHLPHKKVETKPFSFEERDKNKPDRETFVEMILRKEKVKMDMPERSCIYNYHGLIWSGLPSWDVLSHTHTHIFLSNCY